MLPNKQNAKQSDTLSPEAIYAHHFTLRGMPSGGGNPS